MEEENTAILLAIIIGAVILGIGLAMFLNRPYSGYGAVVLAIGLMTLSLIITMRAEEIIQLKIIPSAARSETIAEFSVESPSKIEFASQPSSEMQNQETLEPEEPYEVQLKQAPSIQEIEETQQVQESSETHSQYETEEPPRETEEYREVEQVEENQQLSQEPDETVATTD